MLTRLYSFLVEILRVQEEKESSDKGIVSHFVELIQFVLLCYNGCNYVMILFMMLLVIMMLSIE